MLGTLVNAGAIIAGGILGMLLQKGLPENLRKTLMAGMGLCVVLIGLKGAFGTGSEMLVILSVVIGSIIGVLLKLEQRLERVGNRLQVLFATRKSETFAKGFVTATLMYCVGAMAIVGSMDSGLRGDHSTLLAKSILDGVSSVILTSMMGPGVLLSAASVLVYQGAITLLAQVAAPILTERVITEMSAVGGLLVVGIGLNMIRKDHIPVGDMLPAMFMPLLLTLVM